MKINHPVRSGLIAPILQELPDIMAILQELPDIMASLTGFPSEEQHQEFPFVAYCEAFRSSIFSITENFPKTYVYCCFSKPSSSLSLSSYRTT
jgi:hypothetical protein